MACCKTINDIIIKSAEAGLKLQRKDGSFPAGHNGPWNDLDTSIRVTAHWAITFLKAYQLTKNNKFKKAAIKAGEYLLSEKCRPNGFSFFCRNSSKNKCNGLIGQAWVIEALIELGQALKQKKYFDAAEDVILKHYFDKDKNLWHNLEIDGKRLGLNRTLNQQIWFGAMAYKLSQITKNEIIKVRALSFFNNLPKHIYFNGKYITHLIHPLSNLIYREEARGYASFVLMGLSHIYNTKHLLLDKKVIEYVNRTVEFLNRNINKNISKFCWSYNPTGFEVAYTISAFKIDSKINANTWISEQLKRHFDFKTYLMNKNTSDPYTLAARIYELTRLPNMKLNI